MPASPFIRTLLPLALGLIVGGAGAWLFIDSMPGEPGSAQERADRLEVELKRANDRMAAMEAAGGKGQDRFANAARRVSPGNARDILEDLRAGRPVNLEEIYNLGKPLIQSLAPLFDRMRVKEQRRWVDTMTGELSRKYALTPGQQGKLREWFDARSAEEARRWTELLASDSTRLEDVARASRRTRLDEGLETFMEGVLPAEKLAAFKSERRAEKIERVNNDADMKVQRLNSIVTLDDAQREQAFALMARSSRDYDPSMILEGPGGRITGAPPTDRQAALLEILTPDQRAAYDVELRRKRAEAEKDLNAIGLTLPPNWEMLDDANF